MHCLWKRVGGLHACHPIFQNLDPRGGVSFSTQLQSLPGVPNGKTVLSKPGLGTRAES